MWGQPPRLSAERSYAVFSCPHPEIVRPGTETRYPTTKKPTVASFLHEQERNRIPKTHCALPPLDHRISSTDVRAIGPFRLEDFLT